CVDHGMFHERHADAADHPADALAASELRVDDATGSVGAGDAPHARLTEVRIDGHFDEHRAESMHGEALARLARLHVGRGFHRLVETAHGFRDVVRSTTCKRILTRAMAGRLYGAADARHR